MAEPTEPEREPMSARLPLRFGSGDIAHKLAKVALSALPWPLGSVAPEFWDLVVAPPTARKIAELLHDAVRAINELQAREQCRDWEAIAADPSFVPTVVQATRIAQAQHQREMLEALRNVLVSTAAGKPALDDDARAILLLLLERFTPSHLLLLRFLDDTRRVVPSGGFKPHWTIAQLLNTVHPEFRSRSELRQVITRQLYEMHLINVQELTRTAEASHTLPLGKRLLALVADPSTWPQ